MKLYLRTRFTSYYVQNAYIFHVLFLVTTPLHSLTHSWCVAELSSSYRLPVSLNSALTKGQEKGLGQKIKIVNFIESD